MVVIGNPPYNKFSSNESKKADGSPTWVGELLDRYKPSVVVNAKREKTQWLDDDYVKFLRFAHWRVMENGNGMVSFITPHGFLDNPTFKAMREALLEDFDHIYILDLHGNANRGLQDGDINVFDIKQGVCITFLVRTGRNEAQTVRHAELKMPRAKKLETLASATVDGSDAKLSWRSLAPRAPEFLLVPTDETHETTWNKMVSVTALMPSQGNSIVTSRDGMVIGYNDMEVLDRVKAFRDAPTDVDALEGAGIKKIKKGWSVTKTRTDLEAMSDADLAKRMRSLEYRPFDMRRIFYDVSLVSRPVKRIMDNLAGVEGNLLLLTTPQVKGEDPFRHVRVSEHLTEAIGLSNMTSVNAYAFPLWLSPSEGSNSPDSPRARLGTA